MTDTITVYTSTNTVLCQTGIDGTLIIHADTNTLSCPIDVEIQNEHLYIVVNEEIINCTNPDQDQCKLLMNPAPPQPSFIAPSTITDNEVVCIPISNPDSLATQYSVQLDGQSISDVVWDGFCLKFKLDSAFPPNFYDVTIHQIIENELSEIEGTGTTFISQTIAPTYQVDYSGNGSITIYNEDLFTYVSN